MLQRCTSAEAGDYYGCDPRLLSPALSEEIHEIMNAIETQTNAMHKTAVIADHFLFHALMEIASKPVAHIVTTSEGVTYLHEMHAIAIRQEGTYDKDMIVVHLDERSNKYRVLLEPRRTTTTPANRDGMNNTLVIPSLTTMFGEEFAPQTRTHRRIQSDHTKYQVEVTSSQGAMDVTVDGIPLEGYSPGTQVHVLAEINHQGAAGGGHTQIPLRPDGETHNA